jgi:hypothetical protein
LISVAITGRRLSILTGRGGVITSWQRLAAPAVERDAARNKDIQPRVRGDMPAILFTGAVRA